MTTREARNEPRTVGEAVDKYGPCDLMVRIADLAEARGRIPVGFWDVPNLPSEWRVVVNGTKDRRDGIEPWHVLVERRGLPVALFNSAEGSVIAGAEPDIAAMLKTATEQSK